MIYAEVDPVRHLAVRLAVQQLPPELRAVAVLLLMWELEAPEVMAMLDISESTLYRRRREACARLRESCVGADDSWTARVVTVNRASDSTL